MRRKVVKALASCALALSLLTVTPLTNVVSNVNITAQAANVSGTKKLKIGQSVRIYAKSNLNGRALSSKLKSISNSKVVSVKKSGKYFIVKGKAAGNSTVTLKYKKQLLKFKFKVIANYVSNVDIRYSSRSNNGMYLDYITNRNNVPIRIDYTMANGGTGNYYIGKNAKSTALTSSPIVRFSVSYNDSIKSKFPKLTVTNYNYYIEDLGDDRVLNLEFDGKTNTGNESTIAYNIIVKYSDGSFDAFPYYEDYAHDGNSYLTPIDPYKSVSTIGVYQGETYSFK